MSPRSKGGGAHRLPTPERTMESVCSYLVTARRQRQLRMSGRRAIGFAMLVCVAVAACSSPEAIRTSGQSGGATAETVTAEWLAGQLPTPYTALVLQTARDRLA